MLELETRDTVTILRLVRGKGNALNTEFLRALTAALTEIQRGPARAAIITATGSVFCAGVDLPAALAGGESYLREFLPELVTMFRTLATLTKPVIAAVNGHAIAGGAIITLACDQRLMARGSGRFGLTEVKVGVAFPTWAIEIARHATPPQHFPTLVGTGRTFSADEALARGAIDELVEPERLLDRALEVAAELASIPAATFAMTKRQIRQPMLEKIARHERDDSAAATEIWCSAEVRQAMADFVARNIKKSG